LKVRPSSGAHASVVQRPSGLRAGRSSGSDIPTAPAACRGVSGTTVRALPAPTVVGSSSLTVRVTDDAAGSARYYAIEVPTGATQLIVATSGGTGDVDLYIRRGELPQEYVYDCRPFRPGNEETCTVASPAAGYWYVMLRGHAAYTDVRLVASHDG